ncbi:hypothetical protein BJ138DRAFT_1115141 [Hygrophoropsis aurantiaca]|uniref:Uncharacterized protein n=1 Tax=Hygrophoropsis aurantiaca TaxID=72124 RepID=A0ACB8A866_9AGAM|nr:hypothetical protein BJ138DRAFT_1115141 [Hygrophoropsis aurantiaca]
MLHGEPGRRSKLPLARVRILSLTGSTAPSKLCSTSPPSPSKSDSRHSPAKAPKVDLGVQAVERFLTQAKLEHLVRILVSQGIDDQEKLDAMSSRPRADVADFLRTLQQNRVISAFEAKVLKMAFRDMAK